MNTKETTIENIGFGVIRKSLIKPYEVSFATIDSIESVWVYLKDSLGNIGLGEAVPLEGYADETVNCIVKAIRDFRDTLIGQKLDLAYREIDSCSTKHPFAASALATAIDFIGWRPQPSQIKPISLVYPIAAKSSEAEVMLQIEQGILHGFKHFKMKVGRCLDHDILSSSFALKRIGTGDFTIRFDANQAYSFNEAITFCTSMESFGCPNALWIEQPLPKKDWQGMKELCARVSFPLMMDESIYNESDILRAKMIGCRAIKLKLVKHPGMKACLRLAMIAKDNGLDVTLGNGVATDISNLCEALVISAAPDLFIEGSECNGFLKLTENIAFRQLNVDQAGHLYWNGKESIDFEAIIRLLGN